MAHDRLLLSVECRPSHQEEAAVTNSFIRQWKKFVTDRWTDITSNHLSINLHILCCLLLSTHLGKSTPDKSYFCTLIGRDAGLRYIHHVHLATCAFIKKKRKKTGTSLFTQLCVLFDINKSLSFFCKINTFNLLKEKWMAGVNVPGVRSLISTTWCGSPKASAQSKSQH